MKRKHGTEDAAWKDKETKYQHTIDELNEKVKYFKTTNDEYNQEKIDLINNLELLASETKSLQQALEEKEAQQAEKQRQLDSLTVRLTAAEAELQEETQKQAATHLERI